MSVETKHPSLLLSWGGKKLRGGDAVIFHIFGNEIIIDHLLSLSSSNMSEMMNNFTSWIE